MLKKWHEFVPEFWLALRGYSFNFFKKDLIAGVTVGIVALPLAMAFAIASGVDPEKGIITAIAAGFLISFLGGSRVQIGGPAAAFATVVYSIVQRNGYDGLMVATFIGGILLILMGIFKWGSLIKFVPHPLIIGFTTGIAVVVFSAQIRDFFGLQIVNVPAPFIDKWKVYFFAIRSIDLVTSFVGVATLFLIFFFQRYLPRVPWGIASLAVSTLFCSLFRLKVATISSYFGALPHSLSISSISFSSILTLIPDGITIALVAGIDALLCAVISDRATGMNHRPNCELIAQGFANLASAFLGGMPATAALARTATNIKAGALTPISGMIHSLALLVLLFSCSAIVGLIPLAALSAILIVVAWHMSSLPHFIKLLKTSKGDIVILLASCLLTILVDLSVAVEVGMLLAVFLFMKQMSEVQHVLLIDHSDHQLGIEVYKMQGPCFFGVVDRLKPLFCNRKIPLKMVIIRMKNVPVLDATALETFKDLEEESNKKNIEFFLTEVSSNPADLITRYGLGHLINPTILDQIPFYSHLMKKQLFSIKA